MKYLIIDWFEIFVEEPEGFSLDMYREAGCLVQQRDYGTRIYEEVATITDHDLDLSFEVRRCPKSAGVLAIGSCHLKMSNSVCYHRNPADAAWLVCCKYGLNYKSVSRCDLCTDFVTFDSGIAPKSFIKRVLNGVYRRSKSGLRKEIVQESWDSVEPNYVAWQGQGMVVRLYDKTLELRQVASPAKRAYISALWESYGLVPAAHRIFDETVPHVWRLEFQIQSASKGWVKVDGSGYFENTIDTYSSKVESYQLFAALLASSFTFYVYKKGSEMSSCERVRLFSSSMDSCEIAKVTSQSVHRADKRLRLLALLSQVVRWQGDTAFAPLCPSLESLEDVARDLLQKESSLDAETVAVMQRVLAEKCSGELSLPFGW